ncbi:hypothetical protein TrispH2_007555 [Trichoplax sp. H2]|nr:hypothetical protein TrispH2_007555 [Trichoplax sp. H2]|eukprot:RDD41364.1 hypothetical protein TrispH2_007555 [Trichoplax sp. H2]
MAMLQILPTRGNQCNKFPLLFLIALLLYTCQAATEQVELQPGAVTSKYTTSCNQYKYFKIKVSNPCVNVRILVYALGGEPNLYVSKDPDQYPTVQSLAWSSYNWGTENITILASDPNFSTGMLYIGVHAYCGQDVATLFTPATYQVSVQFNTPSTSEYLPLNQLYSSILQANKYMYYKFCIPDDCTNVNVKLQNCINATTCPNTYAWPEMLISNLVRTPTLQDRTWKLAEVSRRNIALNHQQPNVRAGHYYVGIYGWCTPNKFCSDKSTCGPCDNYNNGIQFNLQVLTTKIPQNQCKPNNIPSCTNHASTLTLPLLLGLFLASCVVSLLV